MALQAGRAPNPARAASRRRRSPRRVESVTDSESARPKIDCFYVYPTVSEQPSDQRRQDDRARADRDRPVPGRALLGALPRLRPDVPPGDDRRASGSRGATGRGASPRLRGRARGLEGYLASTTGPRLRADRPLAGDAACCASSCGRRSTRKGRRKRLVSAILLGGNVAVKEGKLVGGDFRRRPAARAGQTGCVIAFSTFNETPPDNSRYGRGAAASPATSFDSRRARSTRSFARTRPRFGRNRDRPLQTFFRARALPRRDRPPLVIRLTAARRRPPTPRGPAAGPLHGPCVTETARTSFTSRRLAAAQMLNPSP